MTSWTATIPGDPCSKANSRRIITTGRHPRSIKSREGMRYEDMVNAFLVEYGPQRLLAGPLEVWAEIYYASWRKDLDESILLDSMQVQPSRVRRGLIHGAVYENDRCIVHKDIWRGIDRHYPRVTITVTEIDLPPECVEPDRQPPKWARR